MSNYTLIYLFGFQLHATKSESMKAGLKLREIILNTRIFMAIIEDYEERINEKVDVEKAIKEGITFEGVSIKVCDYDEYGNYIKSYLPIYELPRI